jgi:hypothetical protein
VIFFVGGRWPRPPSLAMNPQFTVPEADELRAIPHQTHRGQAPAPTRGDTLFL